MPPHTSTSSSNPRQSYQQKSPCVEKQTIWGGASASPSKKKEIFSCGSCSCHLLQRASKPKRRPPPTSNNNPRRVTSRTRKCPPVALPLRLTTSSAWRDDSSSISFRTLVYSFLRTSWCTASCSNPAWCPRDQNRQHTIHASFFFATRSFHWMLELMCFFHCMIGGS